VGIEGEDVDGDGAVDNELEPALEVLNNVVNDAAIQAVCGGGPCSGSEETVMGAVQQILDATLSIDAWSNALNEPIQDGSVIDLLELEWSRPSPMAAWCTGTFKDTAFVVSTCGTASPGEPRADDVLIFGPATAQLSLAFNEGGEGTAFIELFELHQCYTEVPALPGGPLDPVVIGGAIGEEVMVEVVNRVVVSINDMLFKLGEEVIDNSSLEADARSALGALEDIDLNGDSVHDSVSAGLIGRAEMVTVRD
jgi:hypothetical protein